MSSLGVLVSLLGGLTLEKWGLKRRRLRISQSRCHDAMYLQRDTQAATGTLKRSLGHCEFMFGCDKSVSSFNGLATQVVTAGDSSCSGGSWRVARMSKRRRLTESLSRCHDVKSEAWQQLIHMSGCFAQAHVCCYYELLSVLVGIFGWPDVGSLYVGCLQSCWKVGVKAAKAEDQPELLP